MGLLLEGWASRQAFTAASFPPGGWLHALNSTLDDLRVGNRSMARSSWASSSTFFVLQIGTVSVPTGTCCSKSLPGPWQDLAFFSTCQWGVYCQQPAVFVSSQFRMNDYKGVKSLHR